MKNSYPVILIPDKDEGGYVVYIPDFNINTQGETITEAIEMARDAIGLVGITIEDDNQEIPLPSNTVAVKPDNKDDIITLVDVDFDEYRRKNDMRTVKKNCTIPSWLNYEAEKAGINFSGVLQAALKEKLHIAE